MSGAEDTNPAPPSRLLAALKSTNRQVLVRGSSAADGNSQAAVSILEAPHPVPYVPGVESVQIPGMNEEEYSQKVFGIARFVQIAPKSILMDLTVRVPPNSEYEVYVSKTGNVVDPPRTTGGVMVELGKLKADAKGYGDMFKEVDGELWEWIGRATVVQKVGENAAEGKESVFAGVVARSAGTWGNEKTVCACSGKTMWEEGREMELKGMF